MAMFELALIVVIVEIPILPIVPLASSLAFPPPSVARLARSVWFLFSHFEILSLRCIVPFRSTPSRSPDLEALPSR